MALPSGVWRVTWLCTRRRRHWRRLQAGGERTCNGNFFCGEYSQIRSHDFTADCIPQAILLGPAIAPIAGGTATYYVSWRFMQGSLGVMGLIAWLTIVFFFPETSQPGARGLDQLRKKEGENYRPRFVFVNPLRPLGLLRSPNLFLIVSPLIQFYNCFSALRPYY
jgi:hypothetical protein